MKLIATKLGKTEKYDTLRCQRRDGTETAIAMPRQGILPHDLIHWVVETTLGYRHGFLGMVAAGADIAFVMEQAHAYDNPALADQAAHAESIVESLQAQGWAGTFDAAMFTEGVRSASAMRGREPPAVTAAMAGDLYRRMSELTERWQQVPWHGTLELDMADL